MVISGNTVHLTNCPEPLSKRLGYFFSTPWGGATGLRLYNNTEYL